MRSPVLRKFQQVARDRTLQRWLLSRLLNRNMSVEISGVDRLPDYLGPSRVLTGEAGGSDFRSADFHAPAGVCRLHLAGSGLAVEAGDLSGLFHRSFDDLEDYLALHRFAWLPVCQPSPDWVVALWQQWVAGFGDDPQGWAWHAYTATERAVNMIGFASRHGVPGDVADFVTVLHRHGRAITGGLEYFGEVNTYNHLANNGRGLFRIGLAVGDTDMTASGALILMREADRIFDPSGMLREGSSHYQLLLCRQYMDCWLAARRAGHEAADGLQDILTRILPPCRLFGNVTAPTAPHPELVSGSRTGSGMRQGETPAGEARPIPLVGDISPDCPPSFLLGLLPGHDASQGWTGTLSDDDRAACVALRDSVADPDMDALGNSGWHTRKSGDWSLLVHAAPGGWPFYPGHGHQDLGGFELHVGETQVFVDPGRGAYGEEGEAAFYRSGRAHNTLLVDGADPYPVNRPYYSELFRNAVIAEPPVITVEEDGLALTHAGFSRLRGVGKLTRCWQLEGSSFRISDRVEGRGRHKVERLLHTTLEASTEGNDIILTDGDRRFRLTGDTAMTLSPAKIWVAYGRHVAGTVITMSSTTGLPAEFSLELVIC
ncbi:MAG: heparinase II/III-family protein [Rhodospirillales bacterium]